MTDNRRGDVATTDGGGNAMRHDGYELDLEDTVDGDVLDERRWIPYYMPHWTTWDQAAARYAIEDGQLVKVVEPAIDYPMQLILDIYEFPEQPDGRSSPSAAYPKRFVVDAVRGYRRRE